MGAHPPAANEKKHVRVRQGKEDTSVLSAPKWWLTVHICSGDLSTKSLCDRSVLKGLVRTGLILKSVKG